MNTGNHIIDKVFLEVNTRSEKEATRINDSIRVFLYNELFPLLEEVFDKYDEENIIRFDSLEIDFNIQDWNKKETVKAELINQVVQQIENGKEQPVTITNSENDEAVSGTKQSSGSKQLVDKQANRQSTFLFFLKNGYLPWYGRQVYITELIRKENWTENLDNRRFSTSLKIVLAENPNTIRRLVFQFSNEMVLALVNALNILEIKSLASLIRLLDGLEINDRTLLLEHLVQCSVNNEEQDRNYKDFLKRYLQNQGKSKSFKKPEAKPLDKFLSDLEMCFSVETISRFFLPSKNEIIEIEEFVGGTLIGEESKEFDNTVLKNGSTINTQKLSSSQKEKEPPSFEKYPVALRVRNAGLVLFCPFLSAFFKNFNWLDQKVKIKAKYHFHAVQALHFLASGNDEFFEGNMLLEKFLCGMPLWQPIPAASLLDDAIKDEANNLMQQIIKNWSALKNTSPDGLRQMFVFRDGKLIQKEKGFRLIVERKAQDILLEKLQWNYSIVKLPWKDELLFVEW